MAGSKIEKSSEENPKEESSVLVEVYGDEEEVRNPVDKNQSKKKQEISTEQDEQKLEVGEKNDKDEDKEKVEEGKNELEVKHLTPLNKVDLSTLNTSNEKKETVETAEHETLKTEVVDSSGMSEKSSSDNKIDTDNSSKSADDAVFDEEIGKQKKAVRGVFGVGLVVFLIIFGLTGWGFYLKTKWLPTETISSGVIEATPEPTIAPTPIATPKPIAKEDVVMEILNGSGVSGLAGKTATIFESLGYVVGSVGNGDDVDVSEVYVREVDEKGLWEVLDDIESELSVSSISGYLDEDSEVLVRIILGE